MSAANEKTNYVCLFCGNSIESGDVDLCALHVVARFDQLRGEQKEQTFFCHINCLQQRAAVHPGNFYISDPEFPSIGE
ncbi:hypothetical protein GCM10027084_04310 [Pseudoxanthomonas sangjuensis]|uniref:hypothetical protein n=1 Tax=Pseudoxanthomonas sangjuensis TaxID=1503750 RepID=UPI001391C0AE|nr:hypothetical protein [Pseudoxanthomonas sangjuensis]